MNLVRDIFVKKNTNKKPKTELQIQDASIYLVYNKV